jgi:hypothetical protein
MRKLLRIGKDVKGRRVRVKELIGLNLGDLEMDMELPLLNRTLF